jgi:hypothetical protein
MKVTGVVQCKNEWPLIALSITHALINHVDEVYVLNDSSTDETYDGLMKLEKYFTGRITIINQSDTEFNQLVETNIVIDIARKSNPDWFYVFDSDEFLTTKNDCGLKEVLCNTPINCCAIKYSLTNFVSTRNFCDCNLHEFNKICYEAVCCEKRKLSGEEYYDEVYGGRLNFFQIPFSSKVIIRNDPQIILRGGSHSVSQFHHPKKSVPLCDALYAAHIPYLNFDRIRRKSEQGYKHILSGEPKSYGWQNQLLYRLESEGTLEAFWERHSISETEPIDTNLTATVRKNQDFINNIQKTIDFFINTKFNVNDMHEYDGQKLTRRIASDTLFTMADLVGLVERYNKLADLSFGAKSKNKTMSIKRIIKKFKGFCFTRRSLQ